MAHPVLMPKLGMTMEEGTLLTWTIDPGERIEKGTVLLVIESEKTEAEIEAMASGFLRHVYVPEGETVPCGSLLAALTDTPDDSFDADAFRDEHDRPEPPKVAAAPAPSPSPARSTEAAAPTRKAVAPAARRLARELDLDPDKIPGSGPGGRVVREDVEAYAEARKALVPVDEGVSLDVPTEGEGDPVLLLPGFGVDVSSFAPQVRALAEHHRAVGVNPRGVALSDAPDSETYDVARTADDAAAVVEGPVHVVGASLGSAVALELALREPGRVRSLTLVTPFVTATPRLVSVIEAWTRVAAEASPDTLARALLPWLFSSEYLSDDAVRERTARGLAAAVARVPASALERTAAGLYAWSGTRAADLEKVEVPTLVVAGDEDLLTPDGEAIASAIPNARCVSISGAGHAAALEAPDAVNAALLEHLAGAS